MRDFSASRWRYREGQLRDATRALELQVLEARRDPTKSERERNDYAPFQDRLQRSTAFGQFAEEVDPDRQRLAQMGLLGTSAAFQVLSGSAWAASVKPGGTGGSNDHAAWLESYLRCLNFIDMVVHPSEPEPTGELWRQRRLTLRICHLMRAMSAASPLLAVLAEVKLDPSNAQIVDDLSRPLHEIAKHHVEVLSDLLLESLIPAGDVDKGWAGGGSDIENTYAFAATSRDGPTTPDEWIFMWSTVISSAIRCWRRQTLPNEQRLRALCPAEDVTLFTNVLREGKDDLDLRFRLFGLWGLSHLDASSRTANSSGVAQLPPHLKLSEEVVTWLRAEIRDVSAGLMSREVSLVDSWQPYSTYMGPLSVGSPPRRATGDADGQQDLEHYRDDVMVVPVVPVLLELLSEYNPRALCRKHVLAIVRASVDKNERRDVGRARPFQLGNRDGVVNLSYWQEAYGAASAASLALADSRVRRASSVLRATVTDNGRAMTLATLIGTTLVAYFAFETSKGVVSGVLFGVLASVLAAVVSPGLVHYLWGHDHP